MLKKPRFYIFLALGLGLFYFGLLAALKFRVNEFLAKQQKEGIVVDHDGLQLQLMEGSVHFEQPRVTLSKAAQLGYVGTMALDHIDIQNIDYSRLLFSGDLNIQSIALRHIQANLKTDNTANSSGDGNSGMDEKMGFTIKLKHLILEKLQLTVDEGETKERLLTLQNFDLDIADIEVSNRTLAHFIPFIGQDYTLASDSIFIKATPYENLQIAGITGTDENTTVRDIHFNTVLPVARYDRQLQKERDHYQIMVDSIEFKQLGMQRGINDQILFSADRINFITAEAEIYRNKLLPDQGKVKPLYGTLLRNTPLALSIDTLAMKQVDLRYSEKSKKEGDIGVLEFRAMSVLMERLGNAYTKETKVHMETSFMGAAPLKAYWVFGVQDTEDTFTFKGELHNFPLQQLNPFTGPYADTELTGTMNSLYFSIYGDPHSAEMDMRSRYDDVKIYLLKSDTNQRKKLVSALVNIFVNRDSKQKDVDYDVISVTVERDSTKSPWNFIYKNIEAGLRKMLLVIRL